MLALLMILGAPPPVARPAVTSPPIDTVAVYTTVLSHVHRRHLDRPGLPFVLGTTYAPVPCSTCSFPDLGSGPSSRVIDRLSGIVDLVCSARPDKEPEKCDLPAYSYVELGPILALRPGATVLPTKPGTNDVVIDSTAAPLPVDLAVDVLTLTSLPEPPGQRSRLVTSVVTYRYYLATGPDSAVRIVTHMVTGTDTRARDPAAMVRSRPGTGDGGHPPGMRDTSLFATVLRSLLPLASPNPGNQRELRVDPRPVKPDPMLTRVRPVDFADVDTGVVRARLEVLHRMGIPRLSEFSDPACSRDSGGMMRRYPIPEPVRAGDRDVYCVVAALPRRGGAVDPRHRGDTTRDGDRAERWTTRVFVRAPAEIAVYDIVAERNAEGRWRIVERVPLMHLMV